MAKMKIQVATVPNGYTLSVDDNDYMYFSMAELLEGFMYHVGLEELAAIDEETMREFLTASIVWKDNGDTVKELLSVKEENESLRSMVGNLKKQNDTLRRRLKDEEQKDNDDD